MKHKVEEITISVKTNNLESAFSKLAVSMFDIVLNINDVDLVITKTIILRSRNLDNLLYQFMKRLYDLANKELFVLALVKKVSIEQISNEHLLTAILLGDKMNPRYEVKDIVKMVTDRNIQVRESIDGILAQINIIVERRNKNEV